MLLDQRRENILELIEGRGFVALQELADATGASESTIRRDLEYLDRNGQIRRTRGGAAYVGDSITSFETRRERASEEKRRLGQAAAAIIQPGETVLLDGGTTTLEVARHLGGKSLQVVTNSLPIVTVLSCVSDIELVFLGGYLYPKTGVTLGPLTEAALRGMKVRRLIMSAGGLTKSGLFNSNSLLVQAEQRMIEAADEVIVVADHSKLGYSELAFLCNWECIDTLIVDRDPGDDWRELLAREHVSLITVPSHSSSVK